MNTLLIQSLTSTMVRNCILEQFQNGPKPQFGVIINFRLNCSFGPLSNFSNERFWSVFEIRLWTKSKFQTLFWFKKWLPASFNKLRRRTPFYLKYFLYVAVYKLEKLLSNVQFQEKLMVFHYFFFDIKQLSR